MLSSSAGSSDEDGGYDSQASNSSDEHDNDIYPPGFPLSPAVYEQNENAEDEADETLPAPRADEESYLQDRLEYRRFESLYPYRFLDPDGVWKPPQGVLPQPFAARLRHETVRKLAMSGHHVEFVPPWTDPDWNKRFVFIGERKRPAGEPEEEPAPGDDPMYKRYAKEGILQTQRPALREEDAIRNPTEAAKRYGIDPNNVDIPTYGNSAATPMLGNFNVPLRNPRETPSNQGVRDVIDKDDYDAVYNQYRNAIAAQGGYATEDDFRQVLTTVAPGTINPALGASCDAQMASALLQYMEKKDKVELQEEYQRLLFAGNTGSELVDLGAWTMDKTADTDLATPLHDLLMRGRWEVTTNRGLPRPNGDPPRDTRKVYNFPTQKGEYCAANDFLWMALQPALQLATTILNSDHPATWAWADIYKMRPCRDSRIAPNETQNMKDKHKEAGVDRKDFFAVYVDEDRSEFFPEQQQLADLGFDSVYWVCELLRRSLQWEINAKYDAIGGWTSNDHQMAWTTIIEDGSAPNRPFKIIISLSADFIWPLLIDDYSQAEKAVCSFTLASTMLHELCVWDETMDEDALVMYTLDSEHNYFADENVCEEGWATENQYWGGAPVHMNKGSFLPETRFTDEVITMGAFDSWPGDLALRIYKIVPFNMIEKFFTQHFWQHDIEKWGHEAMKIWPLTSPKAFCNWSTFSWAQVEVRFGWAARAWLMDVDKRVKNDYEHAVLWAWLRQLTRLAVEPKMCMIRWNKQQKDWKLTDKSLWTLRNICSEKAETVMNYLRQLYDEAYSGQPLPTPTPPIVHSHFREAFAALSSMQRALSHEASLYQLITIDYHRQLDPATKADIQQFYAARFRHRLDGIHLRIAADCIAFLDMFTRVDPMVLLRISQSDPAVQLLDTGRLQLRERFVAVQHAFRPVRETFGENDKAYAFNMRDFANVTPISAVDNTKRIEKLAKKQLRMLTGPLLGIAQGWIQILERAQRLKSAVDGSEDDELNRKLAAAANYVNDVKKAHDHEVAMRFPPAQAMYRRLNDPMLANLLQQNQNAPDPTMQTQRFNTVAPQQGQINSWQTVYAEASGFVPYRDSRTGFTRFHRANIPTEAGPSVNPMAAAQAQAQGQSLVGAFAPGGNVQAPGGQPQGPVDPEANFRGLMQGLALRPPQPVDPMQPPPGYGGQPAPGGSALDAMSALIGERGRQLEANPALAGQVVPEIYNRALQTVAGPNGAALINTNVPGANNLFGTSAAQSSMAQQQLEGLVRQQTLGPNPYATLASLPRQGPGVGVAPPSQAFEPIGSNAFQAYPPPVPQSQQQGFPPQVPHQPQGFVPPPGYYPPGAFQVQAGPQPQGFVPPPGYYPPGAFQVHGEPRPIGSEYPGPPQPPPPT